MSLVHKGDRPPHERTICGEIAGGCTHFACGYHLAIEWAAYMLRTQGEHACGGFEQDAAAFVEGLVRRG